MAATINFLKIYFLHFFTKKFAVSFREVFRGAEFNYGIICLICLTCYPKSNMAANELLKIFFPNLIAKKIFDGRLNGYKLQCNAMNTIYN